MSPCFDVELQGLNTFAKLFFLYFSCALFSGSRVLTANASLSAKCRQPRELGILTDRAENCTTEPFESGKIDVDHVAIGHDFLQCQGAPKDRERKT